MGGGVNISQKFDIQLNNNRTSKIIAKEFLGKDVTLKGVIIGVPPKYECNYGGVSIHTKDDAVKNIVYNVMQGIIYSNSNAEKYCLCVNNPSGGIDTNTEGFYTNGYGDHPTWKIENGVYITDRLTSSVFGYSASDSALTCYVNFIY